MFECINVYKIKWVLFFMAIKAEAEKIQKNTSKMIADEQFLSQPQVAKTVLELCDDELAME